jgi:ATP-binding cassette subfamily B multidrug efflux pump
VTRLFAYLKPFRWQVVGALVMVFFQSLADLRLPSLMARIVDDGIVKGNIPYIWQTGRLMLLVALGGAACMIFGGYLSARASTGFGRELRRAVFTRAESLSLSEFDKIGTSSLITRTTNDIMQVQSVTLMFMRMVIMAPMSAVGGVIMAVSENARLSMILVAVLPIIVGAMIYFGRKGLPMFTAMQNKIDRLNLVLRERLTGVRVVRAFNRDARESRRFDEASLDLTQTAMKVHRLMSALMPVMMLTLNLTAVAILWIGGHRVDAGELQIGSLMAFIQYAMRILSSLLTMSMVFVMLPRATASANRISEVLDSVSAIKDPEEPVASSPGTGGVVFRNVTFTYSGAEKPALSNISFEARPGEVCAILGGTGSGKSTLVSLIPRFYDVDSGEVLVDGVDVRSMTQAELRAKIGFVPQKAVLFSGTIAENLRYGKEDATDEELRRALEIAQALDFVSEMKDGLNTNVAQGGTNLSGGQKQRLSIARALVRRPAIYVFDDSFSAVDFRTDARLRAALRKETKDATVLIVAQRVSTVMDADRIVVLDDGKVVGVGRHKELMQTCEVYREIVLSQLSVEEIA